MDRLPKEQVTQRTGRVGVSSPKTDIASPYATLWDSSNSQGSMEVHVHAAPVSLPAIANRYFHVDAQTLPLTDGARVALWTDAVAGTLSLAQGTESRQPRYDVSGINGRPAVYFDNVRNDLLANSGVSPGVHEATAFFVVNMPLPTTVRFLFGTNSNGKNVFQTAATHLVGMSSLLSLNAEALTGTPVILTFVMNAATSSVRVNGVATTGDIGTPATIPTNFTLGHRQAGTAGQGFTGHIGEFAYFNRPLSDSECGAMERYLSAKWGISISPQNTWFVNSVSGSDANTGRSEGDSVASFSRVVQGLTASKTDNATVMIHAPSTAPLRAKEGATALMWDRPGTLQLVPTQPGDRWYLYGSQRFTTGWTSLGGGVYSRALPLTNVTFPLALVTTLYDTEDQPVRVVTKNTATPTTPAAGQYGYTAGIYYIHLPGDADPNTHTIEVASVRSLVIARKGSRVQISNGHLGGSQDIVVQSGVNAVGYEGGFIEATDSIAEGGLTGAWGTSGFTEGMKLTRCVGRYSANDGFNHHANTGINAVMELVECEGAYNGDEGVSPHDDTILILHGGRYHHNGHGGLTSVNRAVSYVFGSEFDHNRTIDATTTGWDSGGVSILEQSTLVSSMLYSHDHPGPGIEIDTAAGATWTDNGGTRSGTSNGNGAEDVT